jgi:hypothetical protein
MMIVECKRTLDDDIKQGACIFRASFTSKIEVTLSESKTMLLPPKLQNLPNSLPLDGAVRIELVEGIPIFKASSTVQNRIEELLAKQQTSSLNLDEEGELDLYEEIDDYLSFINRTIRNLFLTQNNI